MRLQVFLSHNGVCSRRKAMDIIKEGRVWVNGKVAKEPSTEVSVADKVVVDGKPVVIKKYDYILMHKPAGYVTTMEDDHAEQIVMELLPKSLHHVVPVGRLDKDTEGLLLLTNDGQLAYQLTHPKFDVDKVYEVHIGGILTEEKKKALENGVVTDGKRTAPAKVRNVKYQERATSFTMAIHEGRNRQVKKMLAAVGFKVKYLRRLKQGILELSDLPKGQWRNLTEKEIQQLKKGIEIK